MVATRKVAGTCADAFVAGTKKTCGSHDKVSVTDDGIVRYLLWGNQIAIRPRPGGEGDPGKMRLSDAGHMTQTTKDRLNTILRRCGKDYQLSIQNKRWHFHGVKPGSAEEPISQPWSGRDWDVVCDGAQSPEISTGTPEKEEGTEQNIKDAAKALVEGKPFKRGDERVEVWPARHTEKGHRVVVGYYIRGNIRVADRWGSEKKVYYFTSPGTHVRERHEAIAEACGEEPPEEGVTGNEPCPNARVFDTPPTTARPSPFTLIKAERLTGAKKFGLESGEATEEGEGRTCLVCGKGWEKHAGWDCPTQPSATTATKTTETPTTPTAASCSIVKPIADDCDVFSGEVGGTLRDIVEGTLKLGSETLSLSAVRGEWTHLMTPKEVEEAKAHFRNRPGIRQFGGFIVKVHQRSPDFSRTLAYKGRPLLDSPLYRVVTVCGSPRQKQESLAKFGVSR